MKFFMTLILLAGLLPATNAAFGSTILVTEHEATGYEMLGASYHLKEKTNDVRIAVGYVNLQRCRDVEGMDCDPRTIRYYKVEGLAFENGQVVYTREGKRTVCANVSWKKWLWHR